MIKSFWYTAKNTRVETNLLTFWTTCYNKLISECVRMAYDSLLTTCLLQVVDILAAYWLYNLVNNRLVASGFNKFLTSLQMINCNKLDFNIIYVKIRLWPFHRAHFSLTFLPGTFQFDVFAGHISVWPFYRAHIITKNKETYIWGNEQLKRLIYRMTKNELERYMKCENTYMQGNE